MIAAKPMCIIRNKVSCNEALRSRASYDYDRMGTDRTSSKNQESFDSYNTFANGTPRDVNEIHIIIVCDFNEIHDFVHKVYIHAPLCRLKLSCMHDVIQSA